MIKINIEADDQGRVETAFVRIGKRVYTFEGVYLLDAPEERLRGGDLRANLSFENFPNQRIVRDRFTEPLKYQCTFSLQCSQINVEVLP